MKPKILHIAPMNTSGVPGQFVKAERQMGYHSRLVTLFRDRRGYFEDICLNLPFIDFSGTKWIKKIVSDPQKLKVNNHLTIPSSLPLTWKPHSAAESYLIHFRDLLWRKTIEKAIEKYALDQYDVYQLDGGLCFYRGAHFITKMKQLDKKIICCYTGSDLRTRGVISEIDSIADVTVSVEWDHMMLHPNIHHVFFPFDPGTYKKIDATSGKTICIGHAPTNQQAKGSEIIIPILKELAKEGDVRVELIQNMPFKQAIKMKSQCDIFVDQIGDLGYGINSLESLAMGIATCSCLAPGFEATYPDHPFIVIDEKNLKEKLISLVKDAEMRNRKGIEGREWVKRTHDAQNSVHQIHKLAGI